MRQLLAFSLLGLMAFSSLSQSAHAFARGRMLYCSDQQGLNCYVKNMKLFSQNDPATGSDMFPGGDVSKSNLCVPTASSMLLDAVVANSSQAPVGWTRTSFLGRSPALQVRSMAFLQGTSATNGTNVAGYIVGTTARSADVYKGFGQSLTNCPYIDNNTVSNAMKQDLAMAIAYGHYEEVSSNYGVVKIVSYNRKGGHAVLFNEYAGTPAGTQNVIIHDPWYAHKATHSITRKSGGMSYSFPTSTYVSVPGSSSTSSVLFRSGNQVKFIDSTHTLGAK